MVHAITDWGYRIALNFEDKVRSAALRRILRRNEDGIDILAAKLGHTNARLMLHFSLHCMDSMLITFNADSMSFPVANEQMQHAATLGHTGALSRLPLRNEA